MDGDCKAMAATKKPKKDEVPPLDGDAVTPEIINKAYRQHVTGAWVRSVASLFLWFIASAHILPILSMLVPMRVSVTRFFT
jgi:hypothetical protein